MTDPAGFHRPAIDNAARVPKYGNARATSVMEALHRNLGLDAQQDMINRLQRITNAAKDDDMRARAVSAARSVL